MDTETTARENKIRKHHLEVIVVLVSTSTTFEIFFQVLTCVSAHGQLTCDWLVDWNFSPSISVFLSLLNFMKIKKKNALLWHDVSYLNLNRL